MHLHTIFLAYAYIMKWSEGSELRRTFKRKKSCCDQRSVMQFEKTYSIFRSIPNDVYQFYTNLLNHLISLLSSTTCWVIWFLYYPVQSIKACFSWYHLLIGKLSTVVEHLPSHQGSLGQSRICMDGEWFRLRVTARYSIRLYSSTAFIIFAHWVMAFLF